MKKTVYDIIKKPIITEKSMQGVANKKYTFEVSASVNKVEIKKAVEEIFKVKVAKVNTMNVLGKFKRVGSKRGKRPDWKKAIVQLKSDSNPIEFFESMS